MTLISHPAAGRRLEPRCRPAASDFAPCLRPFRRLLSAAVVGLFLWILVLALGLPGVDSTRQSQLL